MRFFFSRTGLLLLIAGLAGCDSGGDEANERPNPLEGGVLATFSVEGEAFKVWTTNPETIAQLQAVQAGTSQATIPNGPLRSGAGTGNHNAPWTWHLDPAQTTMAELTIEVCSARPSFVENDRDEWLTNVGQFCPWSAVLVSLEDFR